MKIYSLTYFSDDQRLIDEGFKKLGVYELNPVEADVYFCGGLGRVDDFNDALKVKDLPIVSLVLDLPLWRLEDPAYIEKYRKWREFLEKSSLVISISNFTKEVLKETWGIDSFVVRPPINTQAINDAPQPKKAKQVISISRFTPHKRFEFGIEVVGLLEDKPKYQIIGHGLEGFVKEYHKIALKFGTKIKIHQKIDPVEKFRLLKESKVLLAPSIFEGLGLTPVEAFLCGVPSLVTDLPVTREVMGEHYPFFFKQGDMGDCLLKLDTLLNMSLDEQEDVLDSSDLVNTAIEYTPMSAPKHIVNLIEQEILGGNE